MAMKEAKKGRVFLVDGFETVIIAEPTVSIAMQTMNVCPHQLNSTVDSLIMKSECS
jgi:hypothetical protein